MPVPTLHRRKAFRGFMEGREGSVVDQKDLRKHLVAVNKAVPGAPGKGQLGFNLAADSKDIDQFITSCDYYENPTSQNGQDMHEHRIRRIPKGTLHARSWVIDSPAHEAVGAAKEAAKAQTGIYLRTHVALCSKLSA
jgi:hypothetical protein